MGHQRLRSLSALPVSLPAGLLSAVSLSLGCLEKRACASLRKGEVEGKVKRSGQGPRAISRAHSQ